MRIEASYHDGFTERLLSWSLEVNSGKAYLEASWFRGRGPLRARFRVEEAPLRAALPLLSGLEEEYRAPWEDLEERALVITGAGRAIRRLVYGAGAILQEHPEVERFLRVWGLLDDAVRAHLPADMRV